MTPGLLSIKNPAFMGSLGLGGSQIFNVRAELTSDETETSSTYVNLVNMSVTLENIVGGMFIADLNLNIENSSTSTATKYRWVDGASNKNGTEYLTPNNTMARWCGMSLTGLLTGQVLKVQYKTAAGTVTVRGTSDRHSHMDVLEIAE